MTSPTIMEMPPQADTVFLTKKRRYKVSETLGYNLTHTQCTQADLDTGAGPNLLHSKILPYGWQSKLEPYASNTRIMDASNRPIQPIGVLPLWLRLGQFQARLRFLVVSNMATTCILVTSFIDRFVKAIIPGRRKVVLYPSPAVAIVGSQSPTTYSNAPDPTEDSTSTVSNKLKVVKLLSIPPMTRATVTDRKTGDPRSPRSASTFPVL